MLGKNDDSLLDSSFCDFHAVLELVDLHPILEQQAQVLPIRRIELQLQESLVVILEFDEVLRASQYGSFLDVDDEHLEGGRSACNGEVLSVKRKLDSHYFKGTDVLYLEVAGRIGVVEVQVGGLSVIRKDSDSSLVKSSEGLISASFRMTE